MQQVVGPSLMAPSPHPIDSSSRWPYRATAQQVALGAGVVVDVDVDVGVIIIFISIMLVSSARLTGGRPTSYLFLDFNLVCCQK